jgi:UMF1 family MFS transporter
MPFSDGRVFAKLPAGLQRLISSLSLTNVDTTHLHRENVFIPTAILFGLFAIPLFLFVRERREVVAAVSKPFAETKATFKLIIGDPVLRRFFLATFFYMDAVHTTYLIMATYGKYAAGLDDGQILRVMSIAILTAVAGSFAYGWLTDRVSRKTSMVVVIVNWIIALTLAIFTTGFASYLVVAVIAGVGLGGVEVVSRVVLLSLVGERDAGRYFGFFNLTGKASSVIGPQLWALALLVFESAGELRFRIAVILLLLMTIVGLFIIAPVSLTSKSEDAIS